MAYLPSYDDHLPYPISRHNEIVYSFERQVTVDAPSDVVFAAITEPNNFRKFSPDIVDVQMRGEMAKGAIWRETRKFKVLKFIPMKGSADIEVTEYVLNQAFTSVSHDQDMRAQYRFTTRASGKEQTKLALVAEFTATGPRHGDVRREKFLCEWCEKNDGELLARAKAVIESSL